MPDKTFSDETTSNHSDAEPRERAQRFGSLGNVADEGGAARAEREDTGDDAPQGDTVRSFTRAAAQRLTAGADYVRSHDAKRVMADVRSVVTNNPGLALIVAAAGGFVLGRALSRD